MDNSDIYTMKIEQNTSKLAKILNLPDFPFVVGTKEDKYIIFGDENSKCYCMRIDGCYCGIFEEEEILNKLNDGWKLHRSKLIVE